MTLEDIVLSVVLVSPSNGTLPGFLFANMYVDFFKLFHALYYIHMYINTYACIYCNIYYGIIYYLIYGKMETYINCLETNRWVLLLLTRKTAIRRTQELRQPKLLYYVYMSIKSAEIRRFHQIRKTLLRYFFCKICDFCATCA